MEKIGASSKMSRRLIVVQVAVAVVLCVMPCIEAKVFYQNICEDSACSVGCVASSLPQGVCVATTNGGSAVNYCSKYNYLLQEVYMFSLNCTLYQYSQQATLYQCLNGETMYVEYGCPASSSSNKDHKDSQVHEQQGKLLAGIPLLQPIEGHHTAVSSIHHIKHSTVLGLHLFTKSATERNKNQGSSVTVHYDIATQLMSITILFEEPQRHMQHNAWSKASSMAFADVTVLFWSDVDSQQSMASGNGVLSLHHLSSRSGTLHVDVKAILALRKAQQSSAPLATLFFTNRNEEVITLRL